MRLDKYLKVSRVIKRRSVAKQIADQGRITINDRVAKSASEVNVGDLLVINFGNKTLTLKVAELKETTKKDESKGMYTIVSEEYQEDHRL
ncbi:RNA-binding S4 domain-containing protein [Ligilactobacillus faecis]|uniref:RNA-binding S4 domain-containing protein n=1 Tax=Ligilactobacillus faecis TaxID=762833 RepID=UPI0024688337|nr:RNA-binding S4 domain-containing protein [Ligilactobacillus faecis]WGN90495.1 RNA-binding S4 domain-containing protein [Ligilactobacillus faecis]